MELILSQLPESLMHYTGKPVPAWMRFLHPEAAASILRVETETGGLSYTDMWRTAEVSLHARESKTGVQAPGFSAHNYGLAIDFDIDGTMKKRSWTYGHMYAVLEAYGWFCHRRDIAPGKSESWHFNYLGQNAAKYMAVVTVADHSTWDKAVEMRMQELYAPQFKLDTTAVQKALQSLKMYNGDIDGRIGPITKQAVMAFQRAWGLEATGMTDEKLQRTLAFVTATKTVVPPKS